MRKRYLLAAGILLVLHTVADAGTITGTVLDSVSKPVAGVPVQCSGINVGWRPSAAQPRPPIPPSTAALTDATGFFSCQGLPAGTYYLCAIATASGQVTSCDSSAKAPTVSIAADQTRTGVQLVLGSGDVVKVHVNDAAGKLAAGATFVVSFVAADGSYRRARSAGQTGQIFHYELTIPKDQASRLVLTTQLQVLDSQGAAVPGGKLSIPLAGPTEFTLSAK